MGCVLSLGCVLAQVVLPKISIALAGSHIEHIHLSPHLHTLRQPQLLNPKLAHHFVAGDGQPDLQRVISDGISYSKQKQENEQTSKEELDVRVCQVLSYPFPAMRSIQ